MNKNLRGTVLGCVLLLLTWPPQIDAEEGSEAANRGADYVPMIKYESLAMGEQRLLSPGAGLALVGSDYTATVFYTGYRFEADLAHGYPRNYHAVDALFDWNGGRNNYLVIFKSSSDVPVYGGFKTFQAAAVYGRKLFEGRRASLVLGGGVAFSDFGIELADGTPWPLIPVPLIRGNYETDLLSASLEFITGPNLNMVLFPERPLRLSGDLRMDEYRDTRDLVYETLVSFYPSFAGISAGLTNNVYAFDLGGGEDNEEEKFELQYNAVFASLDLAVLKFSLGYVFNVRERYGEDSIRRPNDEGLFFSLEGLYQF